MQSTISLFRHLYNRLPPLFPEEAAAAISEAINHFEDDQTATLGEVEDAMVAFGYDVWPWNQAHQEFLDRAEAAVGDHFLLPKLSLPLQDKYRDFKLYGGTLRDLHSGSPAAFFTPEERGELGPALVDAGYDLRRHVARGVSGLEKEPYLKRVEDFQAILEDIIADLGRLRRLAGRGESHFALAEEIRAAARGFEYGLCLLGPPPSQAAVRQAVDFFEERKAHLDRLRGINVPAEIDFYAQNY